MGAGARIAAGASRTVLHRESAETAQLDAVAARHRRDDLAEDGVNDVLDVALVEMRICEAIRCTSSDLIMRRPPCPSLIAPLPRSWQQEGAKGPETVKVESLDGLTAPQFREALRKRAQSNGIEPLIAAVCRKAGR